MIDIEMLYNIIIMLILLLEFGISPTALGTAVGTPRAAVCTVHHTLISGFLFVTMIHVYVHSLIITNITMPVSEIIRKLPLVPWNIPP
jgi:hypothetical protein